MDKHFYLVSQLPTLFFDQKATITIKDFLGEAKKWVLRRDFKLLCRVNINDISIDKKGPKVWRQYRRFEYNLRDEVAKWRASTHGGDEYTPRSFPISILKEGTPLEIEKRLLRLRWNFIEELEKDHHFDLGRLILYFLKLQILRRLFRFQKEKGMEIYKSIISDTEIDISGREEIEDEN